MSKNSSAAAPTSGSALATIRSLIKTEVKTQVETATATLKSEVKSTIKTSLREFAENSLPEILNKHDDDTLSDRLKTTLNDNATDLFQEYLVPELSKHLSDNPQRDQVLTIVTDLFTSGSLKNTLKSAIRHLVDLDVEARIKYWFKNDLINQVNQALAEYDNIEDYPEFNYHLELDSSDDLHIQTGQVDLEETDDKEDDDGSFIPDSKPAAKTSGTKRDRATTEANLEAIMKLLADDMAAEEAERTPARTPTRAYARKQAPTPIIKNTTTPRKSPAAKKVQVEEVHSDTSDELSEPVDERAIKIAASGTLTRYKEYYKQGKKENMTREDELFLVTQIYAHQQRYGRKAEPKYYVLESLSKWLPLKFKENHTTEMTSRELYEMAHTKYAIGDDRTEFMDPKSN